MSRVLIVDNTDPEINYSGNWKTGGSVGPYTNEYNSTVHFSEIAGDELFYTFYGTQISVYGTIDTPWTNGPPVASFSIDGSVPVAFNTSGSVLVDNTLTSHKNLYQSPGLSKGTHTLSIKTGAPRTAAARLYIDFLTISTGSDSVLGHVIVDERDPAIAYVGSWSNWGVPDEYMGTTRGSPAGGGGSATLNFNGSSVTVFGTTTFTSGADTIAKIGFLIDGLSTGNFTGTQNAGPIKHIPLFHVDGLSNDNEHILEIQNNSVNDWFLDYIVYGVGVQDVAVPGAGGNGHQQSEEDGEVASKSNTGVIAGAVAAAVAGTLAILAIIFLLLRRRKAAHSGQGTGNNAPMESTGGHIMPYNLSGSQLIASTPLKNSAGFVISAEGNPASHSSMFSSSVGPSSVYTGYLASSDGTPPAEVPFDKRRLPGALATYRGDGHQRNKVLANETPQNRNGYSNTARFIYPQLPASPPVAREKDSGIRIPVTAPPSYTPD